MDDAGRNMRKELDERLCKLAPHLFADRSGDMRNTCMMWGFDCGDGWYGLLEEAALKLEPLCKALYDQYAPLEKPWYKHIRSMLYWSSKVPGAFKVLYYLAHKLVPGLSNPFHWYGGGPRASQVKEKYGTLRFYMTYETDEMAEIIAAAEHKSGKTCEECGKPGTLRGHGWYYTRCAKCWKRMSE
jgi:hypothetical protein